MNLERPDLTGVDPEVAAYIEALEMQLLQAQANQSDSESEEKPFEPSEPPTSMNVITISRDGFAKRTPRHFYQRQRRGGMGIFDLDSAKEDPPAVLAIAHENGDVLLVYQFWPRLSPACRRFNGNAGALAGTKCAEFVLIPAARTHCSRAAGR
ncbi:MAG: hypothetical protein M5U34_12430 [Chloroflexi bacterium]|nr:hypothetical protein [Chloroflexota bacterium]